MTFFPLQLPPGIWANGTAYQSKGRYNAGSLVRWDEGVMRPVGPWHQKTSSTMTGLARAMITFRNNSATTYAGIGTHSKLYVMGRDGTFYDITPAGFTPGRADAIAGGGYGQGNYGVGLYGAPRPDTTLVQPASMWTLDTWGQDLVGCMSDDGFIYEWVSTNTGVAAAKVTNAPTANAILVTEEDFLLALGAASNYRLVQWSDQAANTVWTPAATNQAGSYALPTSGSIQCGKKVIGSHLIFTDVDVWRGVYLGPPLVYGYQRVGADCGAVSRGCVVNAGGLTYWMGNRHFWAYNGYIEPMLSEVSDYVFSSFNAQQQSKVVCFHNSQYSEVWWFYPSGSSTEIDRYVIYNYQEHHWNIGMLARTCMADKGIFQYPLMADASGNVWEHEYPFSGGTYSGSTVYATGGPIEIGNGDRLALVDQYVPDEKTAGDVTVTFTTRAMPNASSQSFGPYTAANPTNLRICDRQLQVTYTAASSTPADWRVGGPRLGGKLAGLR